MSTLGIDREPPSYRPLAESELRSVPSDRHPEFRKDIEGLRAVAILLVVGFHTGLPVLRGGFIGVDVFFVVSGYLITGLLAREMDRTGGLDLTGFYARRVRRLLPASLLVVAFTVCAAILVLSPIEVIQISKSAIATASYSSNLWSILKSSDYFSPGVNGNPLIHTWSLAVEEQFYLMWPLVVWFSMRGRRPHRTLVIAMCGLGMLSLVASVWLSRALPSFAFFGTPTRAWEFAAGGLATILQGRLAFKLFRGAATGWIGGLLVLFAATWLTADDRFPSAIALIPVVGTVLILVAGRARTSPTGVFVLLESRVFQFLGGISYSWYLWHWPILVLGRILLPDTLGLMASLPLMLVSLLVAWAAHTLIENPIRFNSQLTGNSMRSLTMGAGITIIGVLIGVCCLSFGRHSAESVKQKPFLNAIANNVRVADDCMAGFHTKQLKICSFGSEDGKTVVLFGDSHAAQWLPALTKVADREHWHLISLLKAACPGATVPVYNPRLKGEEHECAEWRIRATSFIRDKRPLMLLMSSASGYVQRQGFQDPYARLSIQTWELGTKWTLEGIDTTATKVVVLRDTPRLDIDVPVCLSRSSAHPRLFPSGGCGRQEAQAVPGEIWQAESSAARGVGHVSLLDMTAYFCRSGECPPVLDGTVVYRDGNHVSTKYISSLAPALDRDLHSILTGDSFALSP